MDNNQETVATKINRATPDSNHHWWHDRLRWSSKRRHQQIEHTAVMFGCATLLLVAGTGISGYHAHEYNVHQAETVTTYGTQLAFSKTSGPVLTLQRPVATANGTRVYLPFLISGMHDVLSTNANHYHLYVMPAFSKWLQPIDARVVLFGNTGAGCIEISAAEKIEPQPLWFILRNNDKLTNSQQDDDIMATNIDSSGNGLSAVTSRYDALAFKANPGAKNVRCDKNLAAGSSYMSVYNQVFADKERRQVHQAIHKDNEAIALNLRKANECVQRLQRAGYEVPAAPAYTKKDWRPFNAVNIKTGMMKNGVYCLNSNATTATATNNDNGDNNDPDVVNFPPTLKNKRLGDNAMNDANNANNVNAGNNDTDANNTFNAVQNNDDALNTWQSLQTAWNNVLSNKQDIYVTQYTQLYSINQQVSNLAGNISVQSPKHVSIAKIK